MCLRRRLFESAPYIRRLHHVVTYYSATPCRRRTRASLAHAYTCTYYYTRVCDRALARCKRTRDSAAAGKASTTRAPHGHHASNMCAHRASHHHEPRPDAAGAFCVSEASSDGGTGRRQGYHPTLQRTATPKAGWERGVRGEGRAATWALSPLVTTRLLFLPFLSLPSSSSILFLSPFFLLHLFNAEPRRRPEQCAEALCYRHGRAWQCRCSDLIGCLL